MNSRRPVRKSSTIVTSTPSARRRSARCEPMNPAPPVTHAFFMTAYKLKPAATASRWNICTVSREYCIRSLPSRSSFLSRSWVIVMM